MARNVEPRQVMPTLDPARRRTTFAEVATGLTPEAAIAEASRCILCKTPLCSIKGCPLKNQIPAWIALVQQGKFLEAAALTRTTSSMPEVCSRLCPQDRLCEGSCALGIKHEAVAIGAIERFVNDYAAEHGDVPLTKGAPTGKTVAIVGAGPAGLSAAEQLLIRGHAVVLYDGRNRPGGLLANGIPGFKINPAVVERRWRLLADAGATFLGEWPFGERITADEALAGLYDALFIAIGAWSPVTPKIPGLETPGIHQAVPFLRDDARGVSVKGQKVVVLGGGDSAMDCARSAIRRGAASARVVYRRDEENMPGSKKEVKAARLEGAEFLFLLSPSQFLTDAKGRLTGVKCQQMELSEPDAGGRRSPRAVPGLYETVPADTAVLAFGFKPDTARIGTTFGVELTPEGTVRVNPATGATSRVGVFAGGDVTNGADLVCTAVLAGRKAADGIHRFLTEKDWAAIA